MQRAGLWVGPNSSPAMRRKQRRAPPNSRHAVAWPRSHGFSFRWKSGFPELRLAFMENAVSRRWEGAQGVKWDLTSGGTGADRQAPVSVLQTGPPPGAAVTKVEGAPPGPWWPGEGAARIPESGELAPCVSHETSCWEVKNPDESSQAPLEFACKCSLRFLPTLRAGLSPKSCIGFCFPENLASRSPGVHSVPTGQEQPH